jgi:archaellum component FlaC
MLLRISLIIAILAGIGTIVFTQLKTREQIQGIITERENHKKQEQANLTRATKAEKDLAATKDLLTQTKDTLAKTEEELNGTKQQLATATEQLNKAKSDLAKAIEERKAAQAELAKWESLGVKPEQVRGMIADLKKQQDAIAVLEDEKRILARNVKELQNKLDLVLGKEDYVVPLPAGTKGNVVAVDPKWNFVVLDIGADKDMLEGGVLMVHRNSKLVGKVRIREVFQNRSVANVMPGWRLGEIEEGDQVLY